MEKQIEEIGDIMINHGPVTESYDVVDYYAEKLYEAGYRKQEWISVEERLPDETRGYLVVLDGEEIDIRLFNSKNDPYQTWPSMLNKFLFLNNRCDRTSENRVTHWMPLPEPPKGE